MQLIPLAEATITLIIPLGKQLTVGRTPECQILDTRVGREHCVIQVVQRDQLELTALRRMHTSTPGLSSPRLLSPGERVQVQYHSLCHSFPMSRGMMGNLSVQLKAEDVIHLVRQGNTYSCSFRVQVANSSQVGLHHRAPHSCY
jgi:hypothetical protein